MGEALGMAKKCRSPCATLTTGEAARVLGVTPYTVACWIDRGTLAGYRLPPGRRTAQAASHDSGDRRSDRRVSRAALRQFMVAHRVPLQLLAGAAPHVLLASADAALAGGLALGLACPAVAVAVAVADSWVRVGAQGPLGLWDVVVVDFGLGTAVQGLDALDELAGWSPRPKVLALLPEGEVTFAEAASAGAVPLRRPCPPAAVAASVVRLLGLAEGGGPS